MEYVLDCLIKTLINLLTSPISLKNVSTRLAKYTFDVILSNICLKKAFGSLNRFDVISSNIHFKKAFGSLRDISSTEYPMCVHSGVPDNKTGL